MEDPKKGFAFAKPCIEVRSGMFRTAIGHVSRLGKASFAIGKGMYRNKKYGIGNPKRATRTITV